jgi:hypothetical protein
MVVFCNIKEPNLENSDLFDNLVNQKEPIKNFVHNIFNDIKNSSTIEKRSKELDNILNNLGFNLNLPKRVDYLNNFLINSEEYWIERLDKTIDNIGINKDEIRENLNKISEIHFSTVNNIGYFLLNTQIGLVKLIPNILNAKKEIYDRTYNLSDLILGKKNTNEKIIKINDRSIDYIINTPNNCKILTVVLHNSKLEFNIVPSRYINKETTKRAPLLLTQPLEYSFDIENISIEELKKKFTSKDVMEKIFQMINSADEKSCKEIPQEIIGLIAEK